MLSTSEDSGRGEMERLVWQWWSNGPHIMWNLGNKCIWIYLLKVWTIEHSVTTHIYTGQISRTVTSCSVDNTHWRGLHCVPVSLALDQCSSIFCCYTFTILNTSYKESPQPSVLGLVCLLNLMVSNFIFCRSWLFFLKKIFLMYHFTYQSQISTSLLPPLWPSPQTRPPSSHTRR